MNAFATSLLVVILAPAGIAARAATAQVEFQDPARFSDAGGRHQAMDRDAALEAIRGHLVAQAAKRLPADEALAVTVTDVDLAGEFDPRQRYANEVRIVKEIYPPRIDLRFRLTRADGSVVKEGERELRDPGFLTGPTRYPSDSFKYEKAMLDEWLEREFRPAR